MDKKDIFIVILGIIILAAIIAASYFLPEKPAEKWVENNIRILTDKTEYSPGDVLKIKIENNSEEKICFSSCYPYYIQRRNKGWETYHYTDCPEDNVVNNCIEANSVKAFETTLPPINKGSHRLAIEACVACQLKELFRKEKSFFSNQFFIK